MSRPLCPVCGKQIPKLTTTVWCNLDTTSAQARQSDSSWYRYLYLPERPRTKADCQRLSNQQVVSVSRALDPAFIDRFTEWDGESYWTASYPFCKPECATIFARAAYKVGYRLT